MVNSVDTLEGYNRVKLQNLIKYTRALPLLVYLDLLGSVTGAKAPGAMCEDGLQK